MIEYDKEKLCVGVYCSRHPIKGTKFCSDICARKPMSSTAVNYESEGTGESSSLERGGPLPTQLSVASRNDFETKEERLAARQPMTGFAQPTQRSTASESARDQSKTTPERKLSLTKSEPSATTAPTLHVRSGEVLPPIEKAQLESLNLIDESISQLKELMKSVVDEAKEKESVVDPKAINSAVNCAREIRCLLKIKMEVTGVL